MQKKANKDISVGRQKKFRFAPLFVAAELLRYEAMASAASDPARTFDISNFGSTIVATLS